MPLSNIAKKTQVELIQELISDLMQDNFDQIYLFKTLCKSKLLGPHKQQVEKMIDAFKQYCLKGIADESEHALWLWGYMNRWGIGTPQDFVKAINLYEQAIKLGNANAMSLRAYMYLNGEGGPVDFQKAMDLYEQAIKLENAEAMYSLGHMYRNPGSGSVDFQKAIHFFEQAMKLGHADAMNGRAYMYHTGEGGPVDFQKAIDLYEQAIELGDVCAMYNRAHMYRYGQGGPVDFQKAINLYEQAIKLEHTRARVARADMYRRGLGGSVDFKKAINLFEQAIERGDEDAMEVRAYMYHHGQGGPVNMTNAVRLYRRAADAQLKSALEELNKPDNPLFFYHYLMQKNNIEKVVPLVLKTHALIEEFVAFDCPCLLKNNKFDLIKCFIEKYMASNPTGLELNQLFLPILAAVALFEEELGYHTKECLQLKKQIISALDIANMNEMDAINSLDCIINTWYDSSSNWDKDAIAFTKVATRLLKQGVYRMASLDKESNTNFQLLFPNIVLIIGKYHFGKRFDIDCDKCNISPEQLFEFLATPFHEKWLELFTSSKEENRLNTFF